MPFLPGWTVSPKADPPFLLSPLLWYLFTAKSKGLLIIICFHHCSIFHACPPFGGYTATLEACWYSLHIEQYLQNSIYTGLKQITGHNSVTKSVQKSIEKHIFWKLIEMCPRWREIGKWQLETKVLVFGCLSWAVYRRRATRQVTDCTVLWVRGMGGASCFQWR